MGKGLCQGVEARSQLRQEICRQPAGTRGAWWHAMKSTPRLCTRRPLNTRPRCPHGAGARALAAPLAARTHRQVPPLQLGLPRVVRLPRLRVTQRLVRLLNPGKGLLVAALVRVVPPGGRAERSLDLPRRRLLALEPKRAVEVQAVQVGVLVRERVIVLIQLRCGAVEAGGQRPSDGEERGALGKSWVPFSQRRPPPPARGTPTRSPRGA